MTLVQIRDYGDNIIASPARPSHSSWADDILGLDDAPPPHAVAGSIEEEVNSYFSDTRASLTSMRYWEVSLCLKHAPYTVDIFIQENQLRYPRIFTLALDILPIQGSAVPCERVFSSSAETDTRRRNRTSPELMEALQMLKFFIKQGGDLDFTAGTSKQDEIDWLEAEMKDISTVPEDLTSFIASLLSNK